jgi:hypothetical protein
MCVIVYFKFQLVSVLFYLFILNPSVQKIVSVQQHCLTILNQYPIIFQYSDLRNLFQYFTPHNNNHVPSQLFAIIMEGGPRK